MFLLTQYQSWEASLVTLVVLWYIVFMICGSLAAYYLCQDNNKWGIVLFSFSLPMIGTIFSLVYFHKKRKLIKW